MRFRSTFVEPSGGGLTTSVLEAASEQQLLEDLRDSGRVLLKARRLRLPELLARWRPAPRLAPRRLLDLTRSLSALLAGGVPMLSALEALRDEERDPAVRSLLEDLAQTVSAGQPLSEAMARHPRAFPVLGVELVRSGEASGSLEAALGHLVAHLEWTGEIRGTVRQAMLYPLLVGAAVYALVLFLLAFTLPRMGELLERLSTELPASTRLLLGTSRLVSAHLVAILVVSVLLLALAAGALRTRRAASLAAAALSRLHPTRTIVLAIARAMACRTVAVLLRSGIPLVEALRVAARVVLLPSAARALEHSAERVAEGVAVTRALGEQEALPSLSLVVLRAGEESGSLDEAFDQLGRGFDETARRSVARALALLEPAATVGLACVVALVGVTILRSLYGAMRGLGA